MNCPCHSQKPYSACCKPYHDGRSAETPTALMRSRYSAYKLGLAAYILHTTHPQNRHFPRVNEVMEFSKSTEFQGLTILSEKVEGSSGWVTFIAYLMQGDKDVSFKEKSYFEKVEGQWLYKEGAPEKIDV